MKNAEKETLIRSYLRGYNTKDIALMLTTLSEEIIFENYAGNERTHFLKGKEAFEKQAMEASQIFSERNQEILEWKHESDGTWTEIHFKGTLAMDLPNGLKKGEALNLRGKSYFQFDENLISKIQDFS